MRRLLQNRAWQKTIPVYHFWANLLLPAYALKNFIMGAVEILRVQQKTFFSTNIWQQAIRVEWSLQFFMKHGDSIFWKMMVSYGTGQFHTLGMYQNVTVEREELTITMQNSSMWGCQGTFPPTVAEKRCFVLIYQSLKAFTTDQPRENDCQVGSKQERYVMKQFSWLQRTFRSYNKMIFLQYHKAPLFCENWSVHFLV